MDPIHCEGCSHNLTGRRCRMLTTARLIIRWVAWAGSNHWREVQRPACYYDPQKLHVNRKPQESP